MRVEGWIACWGRNNFGQATPLSGEFTSVSAGEFHTCGVMADGSIACWGWDEDYYALPPGGEFTLVSRYHTCGVRADSSVVCWGWDEEGLPSASVSAGWYHSCGLRVDGPLPARNWPIHASRRGVCSISVGEFHSCGLRTDQSVACWGFRVRPRQGWGRFDSVNAGGEHNWG